jgi:hypothetical protein
MVSKIKDVRPLTSLSTLKVKVLRELLCAQTVYEGNCLLRKNNHKPEPGTRTKVGNQRVYSCR